MTILSKLTLSDKTKVAMLTSPEAKLRGKMLEALGGGPRDRGAGS